MSCCKIETSICLEMYCLGLVGHGSWERKHKSVDSRGKSARHWVQAHTKQVLYCWAAPCTVWILLNAFYFSGKSTGDRLVMAFINTVSQLAHSILSLWELFHYRFLFNHHQLNLASCWLSCVWHHTSVWNSCASSAFSETMGHLWSHLWLLSRCVPQGLCDSSPFCSPLLRFCSSGLVLYCPRPSTSLNTGNTAGRDYYLCTLRGACFVVLSLQNCKGFKVTYILHTILCSHYNAMSNFVSDLAYSPEQCLASQSSRGPVSKRTHRKCPLFWSVPLRRKQIETCAICEVKTFY